MKGPLAQQPTIVAWRRPIVAGDLIGGFEVVSQIKQGGMATLLLARRDGPGGFKRYVAIKLMHEHLSYNSEFVHRFLDEARLSTAIQHPNVVRAEDIGKYNRRHYMVLEYVQGASLAEVIKRYAEQRRRMEVADAVAIIVAVADGLHAAHELRNADGILLNVVHRDVSPANILIGTSGQVKLTAFGLAKAAERIADTRDGVRKGTPEYMAPEYVAGNAVDRRADLYALSLALWELLTAGRAPRRPHEKTSIRQSVARLVGSRLSEWGDVPPALDKLVVEGLSADPNARPATAAIFRRRLLDAVPKARWVDAKRIANLLASTTAVAAQKTDSAIGAAGEYVEAETVLWARVPGGRVHSPHALRAALFRVQGFGTDGLRRLRKLPRRDQIGLACALAVAVACGWFVPSWAEPPPVGDVPTGPRSATDGVSPDQAGSVAAAPDETAPAVAPEDAEPAARVTRVKQEPLVLRPVQIREGARPPGARPSARRSRPQPARQAVPAVDVPPSGRRVSFRVMTRERVQEARPVSGPSG